MFGTIRGSGANRFGAWVICASVLVAGCAGSRRVMPHGDAAYEALRGTTPPEAGRGRIRPTDKLDIHVLFEPDFSRDQLRVDTSGIIELPFVGQVKAAGLTAHELADAIRLRLSSYIKDPQVDVSVASTVGDHVTVEGNVNDPGVFDIAGNAGLLEVLARAKSPNRTASLRQVVVFREVEGRRLAAVFDVSRIRRGVDQDPTLYPGDTVVVGFSFIKGAYRDFLVVAPATVSIFRPY